MSAVWITVMISPLSRECIYSTSVIAHLYHINDHSMVLLEREDFSTQTERCLVELCCIVVLISVFNITLLCMTDFALLLE